MVTVITYGTYDLLHRGHIRLLERAKALGDYLIVGVTTDDFDKTRGKINVQQSLMERIEAVKATGIADKIIVEEYEGQKIDDILRYNVDIFTVGSDWVGKFDYLNEYCTVTYLERTAGVSSSEIRAEKNNLCLGLVGESSVMKKHYEESRYVNGVDVVAIYTSQKDLFVQEDSSLYFTTSYEEMLSLVDAVYIASHPTKHYEQIKTALARGKHILCESPIALTKIECQELFELAKKQGLVLMDAIKTAYSTAYNRLLLLLKSGKIGNILSVDATCTSLKEIPQKGTLAYEETWNSICAWGPTAMLPIFQILGTEWTDINISSLTLADNVSFDLFTKINFTYLNAVASLKVGNGVKSEGELIISGTKGYVYVPAPWWKTDYFEIRYEEQENNKKFFYQLDGEGIRYELVAFVKAILNDYKINYIDVSVSNSICGVIEKQRIDKLNLELS